MESTIVHVGIRASDLGESIAFWRDALGLSVVGTGENHYDLTDGHHNIRVFQHTGEDRPPHVGGMLDYLHVGVRVPNLRAALERFEDAGYDVFLDDVGDGRSFDPNDPPEESFKVSDPDGVVVDVTDSDDQWPTATVDRD